ncbi:hypothetical protein, partial [Escherichia coli]|uniref:hypothetical protein n=1 Tax=Escherichia coli TaxID=562 RepID=UPI00307A8D5F
RWKNPAIRISIREDTTKKPSKTRRIDLYPRRYDQKTIENTQDRELGWPYSRVLRPYKAKSMKMNSDIVVAL